MVPDGGFEQFNDDDFILFTILADDGNEREYRKVVYYFYRHQSIENKS
jgi:hypothetical protein